MTDTTVHPDYATCTGCTQSKGVNKYGRIKRHNRTNGYGSWQSTVECPGSDRPYAEANREEWSARLSRWQDMPLLVPITEHDGDGETPAAIEVYSFPDSKKGYARFVDEQMSLHMFLVSEGERGRSEWRGELRDADGTVLKTSEPKANDGSVNGLVLGWMEDLGKESASAAGGAR